MLNSTQHGGGGAGVTEGNGRDTSIIPSSQSSDGDGVTVTSTGTQGTPS